MYAAVVQQPVRDCSFRVIAGLACASSKSEGNTCHTSCQCAGEEGKGKRARAQAVSFQRKKSVLQCNHTFVNNINNIHQRKRPHALTRTMTPAQCNTHSNTPSALQSLRGLGVRY